jgi:hypothetical protein
LPSGLARVLKSYQTTTHEQQQYQVFSTSTGASNTTTSTSSFMSNSIPAYLVVLDDDTYLNMPHVMQTLQREYPAWDVNAAAHVVAGCMVQEMNFTFPFGGWSTIFSARAIQNFIRPIYCNDNSSDSNIINSVVSDVRDDTDRNAFVTAACLRLSESLLGEQAVFQDGMSVADLMDAYVTRYPYLNIKQWIRSGRGVGYCLHSDWLVGYFVNFYNIASRRQSAQQYKSDYAHNLLQGYMGSTMYAGEKRTDQVKSQQYKECHHDSNEKCTSSAHICHYVTPDHMRTLYQQSSGMEVI